MWHFSSKISPPSVHFVQFLGPFLNDLTLDSASAKLFGDTPGLSHTFQIHFTVVTDLLKRHLFLCMPTSEMPWRYILLKITFWLSRGSTCKVLLKKERKEDNLTFFNIRKENSQEEYCSPTSKLMVKALYHSMQ